MKVITITCDHCGGDLSKHNGRDDKYRLSLSAEVIWNTSISRFGTYTIPPIKEDLYFCNLSCTSAWLQIRA